MKKQNFREQLVKVRKARSLTQEEVANRCKITVRTIQRIESGQVMPRAHTIRVISDNLGISFFETSNNNVKNKELLSKSKTPHFYWFAQDLLNLRTNTVKKISMLTTLFLLVGFALFFNLNSAPNVQTNNSINSLNNYTFNLYRSTKVENENLFIAPFSTYQALLVAYEGSKNRTKQEFQKVLYLHDSGSLNKKYIQNFTSKLSGSNILTVSNTIWLDKDFIVEGKYSKSVSDKYLSDFEQTEFAHPKTAVADINEWVSNKTNQKIDEIISDSDIDSETKLIISNAVYFKGEWLLKFNKQKTITAPFFTNIKNQYSVDFMNRTESLPYLETDEYQFISKPYRNSRLSFGIILPKKLFGIKEIEKNLNNEFYNKILDRAYYTKTALSIPKLKLESTLELSNALKNAGLKTAFTSEADFSGITKEGPLHLSKVLHKTWIELDEEKTEAAAATATGVKITGLPSYKIFKADHPFVFIVFDNQSKTILFRGRYIKPSNGKEIEKEMLTKNLEKRTQEKFAVGHTKNRILIVLDNKIISQDEFETINTEDIETACIYKDNKEISKYSSKNYDGVIVVTLKKGPNKRSKKK